MRLRSLQVGNGRLAAGRLTLWSGAHYPYEGLYLALLIGQALAAAVWVVYSPV